MKQLGKSARRGTAVDQSKIIQHTSQGSTARLIKRQCGCITLNISLPFKKSSNETRNTIDLLDFRSPGEKNYFICSQLFDHTNGFAELVLGGE